MSDRSQGPDQDEFEVEVSDVPPNGEDGRRPAARLSLQARLSRRARVRRVGMVASALLLLLVVIVATLPGLRGQVVGLVTRFIPTPTATLAPGADRLYLSADVPWTTITLDGQTIQPPRIGVDAPLHLARGRHTLTWHAAPFLPQQCSLDVPPTTASSCPIIEQIRQGKSGPLASVIALHESLNTLSINQLHMLTQAIQTALSSFSDIVQPGEAYFGEAKGDTTVTQPIRAMLLMYAGTDANTQQSCTLSLFIDTPCAIAGQNCTALCTVPWRDRQTAAAVPAAQDWLAFAVIHSSWYYTTLDGQSIAGDQPIDSGRAATLDQPVLLRIGWDGASWQVQPLFGPEQGTPVVVDDAAITDDPACWAAEDYFIGQGLGVYQYRFVSGPNPAVGCLVAGIVSPTPAGATPPPDAPVAYWLVRFGALLTVNATARSVLPPFLLADAYEQALAQQLAALPGGLSVTPP